jgi:hypothetical protein
VASRAVGEMNPQSAVSDSPFHVCFVMINSRMLPGMTRIPNRKPVRLSVIWMKDEGNNWEDAFLKAFNLLLGDDPLPPVDKPIDLNRQNSHHVDN